MPPSDRPAVIYVDDEPINLKVFEASFKNRFRVVTCLGGAAALEALRARPGDIGVLITDQRMPVMTGVQLLEKVREEFPDVQRMIITAYSDMQAVVDSVNRGQVSRYFVKPWAREELSSALEDSLHIFELQNRLRDVEVRMLRSERLAAIGQVSAGIAHELMNPVSYLTQNVVTLRTELLEIEAYARARLTDSPAPGVSAALDDLPALLSDVEQGAQLVRQLALGVRTQARGEDADDQCEVSEVAHFASRLARAEVRQRADMVIKGPAVKVRGGQVKLTQVLLNLIVNAAQAMESTNRKGTIEVSWEDLGARGVRLWVKDNGSGIPPELHEQVFEPLFTTRPIGVGTGLGLAICRDLIQSVGGEISLQSRVGVGTTIEIWLKQPAVAATQAG
jgi:two-component system NtrC family sensor kinase